MLVWETRGGKEDSLFVDVGMHDVDGEIGDVGEGAEVPAEVVVRAVGGAAVSRVGGQVGGWGVEGRGAGGGLVGVDVGEANCGTMGALVSSVLMVEERDRRERGGFEWGSLGM